MLGPIVYSTLNQSQLACFYDKTCTGVVQKTEDTFYICYGGIWEQKYTSENVPPEDYVVYKKEPQYRKKYETAP